MTDLNRMLADKLNLHAADHILRFDTDWHDTRLVVNAMRDRGYRLRITDEGPEHARYNAVFERGVPLRWVASADLLRAITCAALAALEGP